MSAAMVSQADVGDDRADQPAHGELGRAAPTSQGGRAKPGLPPGCVVVTVQHNGALSHATGSTEIAPGDTLSMLVPADQVGRLRDRLRGEDKPLPVEGTRLLV